MDLTRCFSSLMRKKAVYLLLLSNFYPLQYTWDYTQKQNIPVLLLTNCIHWTIYFLCLSFPMCKIMIITLKEPQLPKPLLIPSFVFSQPTLLWWSSALICHFLPFIPIGVVSGLPRRARTASILSSLLNPIPSTRPDASWEFKKYLLSEQMKESSVTLFKPGHPGSSESISA